MGVMSKLLYSLVPKSLTGIMMWVIPIAAAVIVVAYPQAVTQLLVKDDPQRLLEELTADEEVSKEGKKKKTSRNKVKKDTIVKKEEPTDEAEEMAAEGSADDEDEQLLKLASVQAKKAASTVKKSNKPTPEVISPTVTTIEVSRDDEKDDFAGEWSRIPTRDEEIISSLKTRINGLTTQLESATTETTILRDSLEKSVKRAADAERELKERGRTFQSRWLELESEVSNLKINKMELLNKIAEFEGASRKETEMLKTIQEQSNRILGLQAATDEVKLLKGLAQENNIVESKYRAEIEKLQAQLAREMESMALEKHQSSELKNNLIMLNEQASGWQVELEKSKIATNELSNNIRYLENELEASQATSAEAKKLSEELQALMQSNKAEVEGYRVEIERLVEQAQSISMMKAENVGLKEKVKKLEEEKDEINSKLDEVRITFNEQVDSGKQDAEKLSVSLSTIEIEHNQMKESLSAIEVERIQLKESLLTFKADHDRLMEEANLREGELKKQVNLAERKYETLAKVAESKYDAYKMEIASLKGISA